MTDSVAFSPQGLAQLLGIYRYIEKAAAPATSRIKPPVRARSTEAPGTHDKSDNTKLRRGFAELWQGVHPADAWFGDLM